MEDSAKKERTSKSRSRGRSSERQDERDRSRERRSRSREKSNHGKEMEKDLRKVRIICIELMINMEYILMSKIWCIIATMITLSGIRKMEVKRQEVLKKYLYYEYVSILFRILLILWYVLREKVLNTKDRKWLINVLL